MTAETNRRSGEEVIGVVGQTPITKVGWTWAPVTQLILWAIFTRSAARRKPDNSRLQWSREGFLKMVVMLGSEWCHNLAHLAASNWIGKPMDQMRIQFGMPRCIYHDLNDQQVTPRQHIIRSLGGPVVNLALWQIARWARTLTKSDTIAGETASTTVQTNFFLSWISLLPIPGIDGGPILKWSLVQRGKKVEEADQVVKQINGPLALTLGLISSWAFLTRRILLGLFSLMMGGVSLSIFTGWLKEEEVTL
jgi:Zn-dependent protease